MNVSLKLIWLVVSLTHLFLMRSVTSLNIRSSSLSRTFFSKGEKSGKNGEGAASPACGNIDNICLSENCIHISSKILDRLGQTSDPCENFYKFACGKWIQENAHEITDDTPFFASNMNEMTEKIDQVLEDLLTEKRKIGDYFYQTKVYSDMKAFYTSCMDIERIETDGYGPAIEVLKSLEEFSIGKYFVKETWNLTLALTELMKLTSAPLFDVSLDSSVKNSSQWMPFLSTPKHHGLISGNLIRTPSEKKLSGTGYKLQVKTAKKTLEKLMEKDIPFEMLFPRQRESSSVAEMSDFVKLNNKKNHKRKPIAMPSSISSRIIGTNSAKDESEVDFNTFSTGGKNSHKENGEGFRSTLKNKEAEDKNEPTETNNVSANDVIIKIPVNLKITRRGSPVGEVIIDGISQFDKENTTVNDNDNIDFDQTNNNFETVADDFLNASSFQNATDISDEENNGISKEELYKLILENEENYLDLLKLIGIVPTISREDVYDGVKEEMDATRMADIKKLLNQEDFGDLFLYNSGDVSIESDDGDHIELKDLSLIKELAIDRIMDFLSKVYSIEPTERESLIKLQRGEGYVVLALREVQEKFPLVQWSYLLNEVFKGPITEDEEILVHHIDYISNLFEILKSEESWVVHYGILALFTFDVLKELVTISEDIPHRDFCLTATKDVMSGPLTHMYLKFLGEDALENIRKELKPVVNSLKKVAKETMTSSSLLSEADKTAALLKIDEMNWEIGGLDDFYNITFVEEQHKNLTLDHSHFLDNVMEVYRYASDLRYELFNQPVLFEEYVWSLLVEPYTLNAFHIQSSNSIVIPQAFLNPPYYYRGGPSYLTFGSAAAAFAHEMVHAFDFTGSQFDHSGTKTKPFSPTMMSEMDDRIECFNNMVTKFFSSVERIDNVDITFQIHMRRTYSLTMNPNHGQYFCDPSKQRRPSWSQGLDPEPD